MLCSLQNATQWTEFWNPVTQSAAHWHQIPFSHLLFCFNGLRSKFFLLNFLRRYVRPLAVTPFRVETYYRSYVWLILILTETHIKTVLMKTTVRNIANKTQNHESQRRKYSTHTWYSTCRYSYKRFLILHEYAINRPRISEWVQWLGEGWMCSKQEHDFWGLISLLPNGYQRFFQQTKATALNLSQFCAVVNNVRSYTYMPPMHLHNEGQFGL
jgi:hypothetical protein